MDDNLNRNPDRPYSSEPVGKAAPFAMLAVLVCIILGAVYVMNWQGRKETPLATDIPTSTMAAGTTTGIANPAAAPGAREVNRQRQIQ